MCWGKAGTESSIPPQGQGQRPPHSFLPRLLAQEKAHEFRSEKGCSVLAVSVPTAQYPAVTVNIC